MYLCRALWRARGGEVWTAVSEAPPSLAHRPRPRRPRPSRPAEALGGPPRRWVARRRSRGGKTEEAPLAPRSPTVITSKYQFRVDSFEPLFGCLGASPRAKPWMPRARAPTKEPHRSRMLPADPSSCLYCALRSALQWARPSAALDGLSAGSRRALGGSRRASARPSAANRSF